MKHLLLFLSLLLLIGAKCFASQDTTSPLKIEVRVVKAYEVNLSQKIHAYGNHKETYAINEDSVMEKRWDVDIMVTNTGTDTIAIRQWRCSWDESFKFSNDYIYFLGWPCDSNYPSQVAFKPGESRLYQTTLRKRRALRGSCKSCYYNPPTELGTQLGRTPLIRDFKQKVAWSNAIYLFKNDHSEDKTADAFDNKDHKYNIVETICTRREEPGAVEGLDMKIKLKKQYTVTFSKEHYAEIEKYDVSNLSSDSVVETRIDIEATLKNTSKKTMQFSLGRDSISGNKIYNLFFAAPRGINVENGPHRDSSILVVLKPGEEKAFPITLRKSIWYNYLEKYLQLGLSLHKDIFSREPYDKRKEVWSNPIEFSN